MSRPTDTAILLLARALPFLREASEPFEDDGSNEPLELAREIDDFMASLPPNESALSSASSAFDGDGEAANPPPTPPPDRFIGPKYPEWFLRALGHRPEAGR